MEALLTDLSRGTSILRNYTIKIPANNQSYDANRVREGVYLDERANLAFFFNLFPPVFNYLYPVRIFSCSIEVLVMQLMKDPNGVRRYPDALRSSEDDERPN